LVVVQKQSTEYVSDYGMKWIMLETNG
jgi:hypothetical protein